jgi:hypothetical protein
VSGGAGKCRACCPRCCPAFSEHEPSQRHEHVAVERVGHQPIAPRVIEHDTPPLDLIGEGDAERVREDRWLRRYVVEQVGPGALSVASARGAASDAGLVGQRNLAVTANTYTHVLTDETELDYAALLVVQVS